MILDDIKNNINQVIKENLVIKDLEQYNDVLSGYVQDTSTETVTDIDFVPNENDGVEVFLTTDMIENGGAEPYSWYYDTFINLCNDLTDDIMMVLEDESQSYLDNNINL